MRAAQTVTGALTRLQGEILIVGTIEAVAADGRLFVVAKGVSLVAIAVVDHVFRAGESVLLAWADDGAWVVLGPAHTVTDRGDAALPARGPEPSSALAAPSLSAAVTRLISAQHTILRRGTIETVFADGRLLVHLIRSRFGTVLAGAATTEQFRAGAPAYAIQTDAGGWLVLGSPGR